jgi:hypothetical protein
MSGYAEAPIDADSDRGTRVSRVFEDPYGIVAVHVFDTWQQLVDRWNVAQGQLVDLISTYLRGPEPKAWEGYLVLLTPGLLPAAEAVALNELRNDTNRVRKIVATGADLGSLDDVRGALLPLLPLALEDSTPPRTGVLELLPELLGSSGVSQVVTGVVIDAFAANESILERLHELGTAR